MKHANVRWLRMCGCGLAVLAAGLLLVASLALPVQASALAQEGQGNETAAVVTTPAAPQPEVEGPYVGQPVFPVVLDADLRQLPQAELRHENIQRPWRRLHPPESRPEDKADEAPPDALAQTQMPLAAMPSPLENFDGLSLTSDCGGVICGSGWPPDTNGDVGPVYYVQAVNTAFGIFNKATGARLTALTFDTLFFGTNTACDDSNFGDPIVLYDAMADRWILTDFAWDTKDTDTGPYYECIAVSRTGDPVTGGWYLYALRADDDSHPWLADYPKLGVWPDGYYMSANMFDCVSDCGSSSPFEGVRVWALNRTALINGQALQEVHFDIPSLVYDEVMLPANLRGALPPGGAPNFFVAMDDNFTFGGNDVLHLWKFRVNWAAPANYTFTTVPTDLIVSPFTLPSSEAGVPQLGTSAKLDTLGDRLMMQLQYRNINGIESLWVNHTVASGGVTGIRWYELRNPNGTPVVYQQGTYQPDSTYRWMGSLAVDNDGNMALGFSASSSSIYPAIRYAGRLVT
ncbi:MAG TPA: hypothetical protein VI793_20640, partial [Anaerolineales bacterium]|nr:hypothetical protein [Anaerolineales bacterium]